MSAAATTWAWDQDVSSTGLLILLAYTDQSRDDGTIQLTQSALTLRTGLSVRAVRDNLARMEDAGKLRRYPRMEDGKRIADITKLAVDGSVELPADFAGGSSPSGFAGSAFGSTAGDSRGEPPASAATGGRCRSPHPSTSKNGATEERGRGRQEMPLVGLDVPDAMVADASELLRRKTKVGTRIVTAEEIAVAMAALAEFNRQAGYDYGLAAQLTALVGRVRERPHYKPEDHVRLVQSAWRLKWWEKRGSMRRPTPAVIYGNAAVFEQVVADATDEKAGVDPDGIADATARRFVRKGAAKPW